MPGKVFISCGQANSEERQVASQLSALLAKQGFQPYVAIQAQSIQDINFSIISNLKSSDFYIFIDFARETIGGFRWWKPVYRGSLFTNQELALAYLLEFNQVLYLQQDGVRLEGLGKYLLSNAIRFKVKSDVPTIVEDAVKKKGWSPSYSRHLVLGTPRSSQPCQYSDHTGVYSQYIWVLPVENTRHDIAAFDTVVRLDKITFPNGNTAPSSDREFLKWAGKASAYCATILPRSHANFDLFALDTAITSTLFLHSEQDITPRNAILNTTGNYVLNYQAFAKGFPLLAFNVEIGLSQNAVNTTVKVL